MSGDSLEMFFIVSDQGVGWFPGSPLSDCYAVLADDFDQYLKQLATDGFPFLEDQDELELHWQAPSRQGD